MPEFNSKVLCLQSIRDSKSSPLLLILTTEEIHLYTLSHSGPLKLDRYQAPLSTDNIRYSVAFQTKKSKRVFIGGDNGKVSELILESQDKPSRLASVAKYIKEKVVGSGSKVKKVDKAISVNNQSMISKIIANFFESETKVSRIVTDMTEDEDKKVLYVAVTDTHKSSSVEVYDISEVDFKLLRRIELSDIFDGLKKRTACSISPS